MSPPSLSFEILDNGTLVLEQTMSWYSLESLLFLSVSDKANIHGGRRRGYGGSLGSHKEALSRIGSCLAIFFQRWIVT
jgi:hypothetical protein